MPESTPQGVTVHDAFPEIDLMVGIAQKRFQSGFHAYLELPLLALTFRDIGFDIELVWSLTSQQLVLSRQSLELRFHSTSGQVTDARIIL